MAATARRSWSAETAASDDSHAPVRPRRCFRAGRSTDGGAVRSAMRCGRALDGPVGAVLDEARDRERGEDDAQVGVGVLALAVAGRAGLRVMPDWAGAGIR